VAALIDSFAPHEDEPIVEIGPGRGALTGPLLDRGARVLALELDRDLVRSLRSTFGEHPALRIVEGDALEVDLDALAAEIAGEASLSVRLVANLPYNVATPIIGRLLRARRYAGAQVMVQSEVADRLTADAGESGYGPLAVLCTLRGGATRLFRIRPGAFRPRPGVVSAAVRLAFAHDAPLPPEDVDVLEAFLHRAFAERRKTMANNLRDPAHPRPAIEAVLDSLGLPTNARAEQVPAALWPSLRERVGHLHSRD
jgi:16S rRNA (adenine1518-N6/adenine1519-N6)-dimethyltransferase